MTNEYENRYDLKAPDGAAFDGFGFSMGVSDDGSVIVMSAPYAKVKGKDHVGKVYIYDQRSYQVIQSVTSVEHQCFGQQLALSGNGRILAVTVLHQTELNEPLHRICIFEFRVDGWHFSQTINLDCMDEFSGVTQLTLDYSGDHLAVSQRLHRYCGNPNHGIVRLYERHGDLYFSSGLLVPDVNNESVHEFGTSIKFNKKGTTIVVGASSCDGYRNGEGAVYVFAINNLSGHRYSTVISPPTELNAWVFGMRVDVSDDGTYLAVSSRVTRDQAEPVIGVHFYRLTYHDTQNVIAYQHDLSLIPKKDLFGNGIALTGNGLRCAVLGFGKKQPESIQKGGVFIIDLTGQSKTGNIYYARTDDGPDTFSLLAMARNGSIVLRGQPSLDIGQKESAGLIQVFKRHHPAPIGKNKLEIGYEVVQQHNENSHD